MVAFLVISLGSPVLRGQQNSADSSLLKELRDLPEDIQSELPDELRELFEDFEISAWQTTVTLKSLLGYRENLGLSPVSPEAALFGELRAESFVWWTPDDSSWEALAMLDGQVRRYEKNQAGDTEQTWFSHAELRWSPWSRLRVSGRIQGYFQDEVLDLSVSASQRTILPVKVWGGMSDLETQLQLWGGFSIRGRARLQRADYKDVSEDNVATEFRGELGWKPVDWISASYGYVSRNRAYDFRNETTLGGRAIADTDLSFSQNEPEARLHIGFRSLGRWRLAGVWSDVENRDEASGFFDYDRERWRGILEWFSPKSKWEVRFEYDVKTTDYLKQTVGSGLTPDARSQDDRRIHLELLHRLSDQWELLAQATDERSESNEIASSYRDRTVMAGIGFTF